MLKSSKSLRLSRKPGAMARRHLAHLAMQGAGGPDPRGSAMPPSVQSMQPPVPVPGTTMQNQTAQQSNDSGQAARSDLPGAATPGATAAGTAQDPARAAMPGLLSAERAPTGQSHQGSLAKRAASPRSVDSSTVAAAANDGIAPEQQTGSSRNLLADAGGLQAGHDALELCGMTAAVGATLSARCNPVVLAAVCTAVDSQVFARTAPGPDPLQLARSALDLVSAQQGGCACLGVVGKEACKYLLQLTGSILPSNGTGSWLTEPLPGPSAHA